MPSSFSFLLNSQSDSSSSSLENDLKSDQSDDDEDKDINIGYHKSRIMQNDNDILERPSDDDNSYSQNDESDDDENDLFTCSTNDPRSNFLSRQLTLYENDWPKKRTFDENKFLQTSHLNETMFVDTQQDYAFFLDLNRQRPYSPERSKSAGIIDTNHQSYNNYTLAPSESVASALELYLPPETEKMQQSSIRSSRIQKNTLSPSPKRTTLVDGKKQQSPSKIPVRVDSKSQSRSRSPPKSTTDQLKQPQPTVVSKIPQPVTATMKKGAFRFFTSDDRNSSTSSSVQILPMSTKPTQISSEISKHPSPFTPINNPKTLLRQREGGSSAGNTPAAKHRRVHIAPTDKNNNEKNNDLYHKKNDDDDDDDSDMSNLPEADLKLKLKAQKRHGKITGELLNKLHENYEELLEKYAQAENTIDQLRFQPKIVGDNTPPSNTSEGTIHFIQQPKFNSAALRSNEIQFSSHAAPELLVRQVPSLSTTTTTVIKSTSPANSGTIESVFFDEAVPQKIVVQEISTPETIKLDLLIQTKTLSDKMKSFLTLMDANQLSLAEQKQVYETIKTDYENLLRKFDHTKHIGDLNDLDVDGDLNQELETMKDLLKEIVKRITDNLLGKSSTDSDATGHQSRLTRTESPSSQVSGRSSLCNHADLMNQYKKLLHVVNTETTENTDDKKYFRKEPKLQLEHSEIRMSQHSPHSSLTNHMVSTDRIQNQHLYVQKNFDDEQQQYTDDSAPVIAKKGNESTLYGLDYTPSLLKKQQHQTAKKKKNTSMNPDQEYDNLENVAKLKRKVINDQRNHFETRHADQNFTPPSVSMRTVGAQHSSSSLRTRISDYDSGIGTNNTTKLSRDSKLNTSIMDESHYQSLDDEKRRYSDEEQESMSSVTSSRSSGSGAASPPSLYSKHKKRFEYSSKLKQLNGNHRRKPSGHSDANSSDVETHITGSFDPLPSSILTEKYSRRAHHNYQPKRTNSYRSRIKPIYRSASTTNIDIDSCPSRLYRPQTAPQISSKLLAQDKMSRKYQSGFIRHYPLSSSTTNSKHMFKSSLYVNQTHSRQPEIEKFQHSQAHSYQSNRSPTRNKINNLYIDSQTGIIYRYVPDKLQTPITNYNTQTSQVNLSRDLYKCGECGTVTTYHHRHHIHGNMRKNLTDIDDPGYESEYHKMKQYSRKIKTAVSSDSETDDNLSYFDLDTLNEAYERAKKMQNRSRNLSKHISRQLKLVLSTL